MKDKGVDNVIDLIKEALKHNETIKERMMVITNI